MQMIDSLLPDMNFQTIWMSKVILRKILSQKSWSSRTILILNML